jgi:hypothetical protein
MMTDKLSRQVEGIQTSFNLITDGFVEKYMKYLQTKNKTEVDAIYGNIQKLGSQAYILENEIIKKSEISYLKSNNLDDKNRELRIENEELQAQLDKINSNIDTAEESYSEELQNYRESFINIILYFILYVIGMYFFLGLGLSRRNEIMFMILFFALAIVFHIRSYWVYGILVVLMIYFRKYLYSRAKGAIS